MTQPACNCNSQSLPESDKRFALPEMLLQRQPKVSGFPE